MIDKTMKRAAFILTIADLMMAIVLLGVWM